MLTKRGTLSGSQGPIFLCVSLSRLTPSEQLTACNALVDLAAAEIVSNMTPENVVDEMFYDPSPCVPSPAPIQYVADNGTSPAKVIDRGLEIIRANRRSGHIRSQLQKIIDGAASGESSRNLTTFAACFNELSR